MKMNKIISTFLAVLMLLGASTMLISAAQVATQDDGYTYNTGNGQTMMMATLDNANPYDYMGGSYHLPDGTEGTIVTEEDKLKTMDYRYGNDTYQLYVDAYSGEVALKNRRTGEILFTNPYNVGSSDLAPCRKTCVVYDHGIRLIFTRRSQKYAYCILDSNCGFVLYYWHCPGKLGYIKCLCMAVVGFTSVQYYFFCLGYKVQKRS